MIISQFVGIENLKIHLKNNDWCTVRTQMTNNQTIAAEILRNIVATKFNISPNEVRISNYQLTPETQFIYLTPDIMSYYDEHIFWGFNPELGFVIVQEFIGEKTVWTEEGNFKNEGYKLHEIENVEKYNFFLHYEKSFTECDEEFENWRIYKSPNFQEY